MLSILSGDSYSVDGVACRLQYPQLSLVSATAVEAESRITKLLNKKNNLQVSGQLQDPDGLRYYGGAVLYAVTDGQRHELSDRWEEALTIRRWVKEIWLELEAEEER